MEKSKTKKGMPVFIGIAAVWMGTHFGPGVASGTQLNQYYVQFGLAGIFVTIIAMGFLGYALYCSMEFSRLYQAYDYQTWVEKLFGNKYVVILFDISFLVTILTAASGSMNAVAVLLESNFGVNYWIGVAIIIVCAMLLCAFGARLVRAASSYMMFIVVGILLVIMILLAMNGDGDLSGSIANQAQNLPAAGSGSWLSAIWSAIIYGSFQPLSSPTSPPSRATSPAAARARRLLSPVSWPTPYCSSSSAPCSSATPTSTPSLMRRCRSSLCSSAWATRASPSST